MTTWPKVVEAPSKAQTATTREVNGSFVKRRPAPPVFACPLVCDVFIVPILSFRIVGVFSPECFCSGLIHRYRAREEILRRCALYSGPADAVVEVFED